MLSVSSANRRTLQKAILDIVSLHLVSSKTAMSLPIRHNSPLLSKKSRSEAYAGFCILGASALVLTLYRGFGRCDLQQPTPRQPSDIWQITRGELPGGVSYGNGLLDGQQHAGWFIGHFIEEQKPQHTEDIEVKFTFNPTGKKNDGFVANRMSRSMAVLISGKHLLDFGNNSVLLEKPGDYAIWSAGVGHAWTSIMDSTVLTLRWPSIPKDQVASGERMQPQNAEERTETSEQQDEAAGVSRNGQVPADNIPQVNQQGQADAYASQDQRAQTNGNGQPDANNLVVSQRKTDSDDLGVADVAAAAALPGAVDNLLDANIQADTGRKEVNAIDAKPAMDSSSPASE
jgi:hypothetical protein